MALKSTIVFKSEELLIVSYKEKVSSKYQKETSVELRDINVISFENLGFSANLKYTKSYI